MSDYQKTNNIFDYATKELSQDAFLMWLFSNLKCDEEDVRNASNNLLTEFGINTDHVDRVEVKPQYKNIDVVVYFYQGDSEKANQALFLEDKTTSGEHNQLQKYNDKIKAIQNEELAKEATISKIYYKTFLISADEREKIKIADWKIFSIKKDENEDNEHNIAEFWDKAEYKEANNLILRSYAEHITDIYKDLKNEGLPPDNNLNAWIGFFENTIIPMLEKEKYTCNWANYNNHYIYLVVRPEGYGEEGYPYYELRSKECSYNCFRALIQIYGVEEMFGDDKKNIKDHMKRKIKNTNGSFSTKNYKQQVGQTEIEKVDDLKDFKDKLLKTLSEYRTIFESYHWDK